MFGVLCSLSGKECLLASLKVMSHGLQEGFGEEGELEFWHSRRRLPIERGINSFLFNL